MDSIIIAACTAIIIASVKNPTKKASLKRAMLKIYNEIKFMYADDPDFQ